jgi:hypothetical protein
VIDVDDESVMIQAKDNFSSGKVIIRLMPQTDKIKSMEFLNSTAVSHFLKY